MSGKRPRAVSGIAKTCNEINQTMLDRKLLGNLDKNDL